MGTFYFSPSSSAIGPQRSGRSRRDERATLPLFVCLHLAEQNGRKEKEPDSIASVAGQLSNCFKWIGMEFSLVCRL